MDKIIKLALENDATRNTENACHSWTNYDRFATLGGHPWEITFTTDPTTIKS